MIGSFHFNNLIFRTFNKIVKGYQTNKVKIIRREKNTINEGISKKRMKEGREKKRIKSREKFLRN